MITLDQHISEKYVKIKEDIIAFTQLTAAPMLSAAELEDLRDSNLKKIARSVPMQETSLDVLRLHTFKAIQSDTGNHVVQSLLNFKNFPFFREKVLQDEAQVDSEVKIVEGTDEHEAKLPNDAAKDNKTLKNVKPRAVLKNSDGEIVTDQDIIDEVHTMYVANNEPLTHSSTYQIIDLLNKVLEAY